MLVDGQEVIVFTREKLIAMYNAASQNGAKRFYLSEDKSGNVRFGALEEVPAHFRRQPLSLSKETP
jgi:hypothetical protein